MDCLKGNKMIKKAILIIAPLFLFSGCFLMKQPSMATQNIKAPTDTMNTKLMVVSISSDCYDCDTFTISVRDR
jgi:uncharacterized lipoprotein YajG